MAADEVYGADPALRAAIRSHGLGYVLAISANRRVPTAAGPIRVDQIPALLPRRAWQKHSAGPGSKGQRLYSWAWIALSPEDDADPGCHYLLIRRNDHTGELAYLRCYSPRAVTPRALVRRRRAALAHRRILPGRQGSHRAGSTPGPPLDLLAPLDHPAMLAHAFLAVATADERDRSPAPDGLIMLTVNEFRRLFDALLLGAHRTLARLLHWSTWQRRHQHRARRCHY